MSIAPLLNRDDFVIRAAESVEEVSTLWWPLMKELGWVRYSSLSHDPQMHQNDLPTDISKNRDQDDGPTHYHAAGDGKNWLMVVPKETGKPEGCIVAFTYPNNTGFVGYFLMNKEFRGRGWGADLFRELLASFKASNTIYVGLDGVEEQVNTYKRRGFETAATIKLATRPSIVEKPKTVELVELVEGEQVVDIKGIDPELLARLDLAHTGFYRPAYWSQKGLLSRKDAYGYALLSTAQDEPKLAGYVLVRRCQEGHRFGPLYAETYEQARFLLWKAMEALTGNGSMIAEIYGSNPQGLKVFEELGWKWAGLDYYRMWLSGKVPKEQQQSGKATTGMFATFDACAG
jgi:GNAT superfamily N-acetyltransferase